MHHCAARGAANSLSLNVCEVSEHDIVAHAYRKRRSHSTSCRRLRERSCEAFPARGGRVERRAAVLMGVVYFACIHYRPAVVRIPAGDLYREVTEACQILPYYAGGCLFSSGFMRLRNITGKSRILRKRNAAETRYTTIPGVILTPVISGGCC